MGSTRWSIGPISTKQMARSATGVRLGSVLTYAWLAVAMAVLADNGVLAAVASETVWTDAVTTTSTATVITSPFTTLAATANTSGPVESTTAVAPPATAETAASTNPALAATASTSAFIESASTITSTVATAATTSIESTSTAISTVVTETTASIESTATTTSTVATETTTSIESTSTAISTVVTETTTSIESTSTTTSTVATETTTSIESTSSTTSTVATVVNTSAAAVSATTAAGTVATTAAVAPIASSSAGSVPTTTMIGTATSEAAVNASTASTASNSTTSAAPSLPSTSGTLTTIGSWSVTASMTDTPSPTKTTVANVSTSSPSATPVTPLSHLETIIIAVPSVVCGVIVITIVIGLAVFCHRRRQIPVMRRIVPPMPSRPTSTPPELVKLSKPVNLADFPEYVKQMSADSCFRFSEEYDSDLKDVGRRQPIVAASLEHNLVKNRFTNILPYDHSRVKLFTSGGDKSDYINANYIPGHNGIKEFIATQGPMQSTVNDFWRMVWEQQCKAIVMLTRCTEGLVDKCYHYWPSGHDAVTYDGVTVQVTDELQQPHWTVTNFSVSAAAATAAVSNGGADATTPAAAQSRHVRHFHYTAFPDHRAPPDPDSMLQFTRMVRSKLTRSPGGGPIVVHCSAGVGRSGTYIAIDRILQQIEDGCLSVDVFGIVRELRMHRMHMVQAEEQYVFIHQIIELEVQQRRRSKETSNGKGIENTAFAGD